MRFWRALSFLVLSGACRAQMTHSAGAYLMDQASGTSMNPQSWQMPMVMTMAGSWHAMFMAEAFVVDTQQSGPRGGDKLWSANWGMASLAHAAGGGSLQFQLMLSLDPATITERRYPELFQTGETAFGRPIVDGQHPHNFIMGMGLNYAHPVGENAMVQIYFAPVGDPALGPVAFPHRASAMELPQATLGHHWQDSTHIADEVITGAVLYKKVRLEASGFYGTEPGESRWTIDTGPINSWATRFSVFPTKNWMAQVSVGRLAHPERQRAGDVVRSTASVHYNRPGPAGSWSSSLIWGRDHEIPARRSLDSYLAESVAPLGRGNWVTGRWELVDKDELFSNDAALEQRLEQTAGSAFRIAAYTVGYTRDLGSFRSLVAGLGGNVSAYGVPEAIRPYYGNHPIGVNIYLRFRLKGGM